MTEPKYQRARRTIERMCSELGVGAQLPGELQLGDVLGVSRITVRRAMGDLENSGVVERLQGKGTWVRSLPHDPEEVITPLGFHAQMTPQGYAVTSRVVAFQPVAASRDIAARLGVPVNTRVHRLQRLRYLDGTLHHLTTAWWPAGRAAVDPHADFARDSLYAVLRAAGLDIQREHISAYLHHPDEEERRLLGLADASPRLATDSTVFSAAGERLVVARTIRYRDDAVVAFQATAGRAGQARVAPLQKDEGSWQT